MFEKYIAENIIPFGLRLKLFPHFKNPSEKFKKNWECTLTNCSMSLIKLLIVKHKKEAGQIDLEFQPLNIRIAALNNPQGLAKKKKRT